MNTTQDDGGPAFPCQPLDGQGFPCGEMMAGMSLRDLFAGMALQGVMVNAQGLGQSSVGERTELLNQVAGLLYETADAMIAARKEQP